MKDENALMVKAMALAISIGKKADRKRRK